MQYTQLGHENIKVSKLCLGTMTWGEQNSQSEAHEQLDLAFAAGINFIDTAEMYPVPPKAETFTKTETIIGNWPKLKTQRDKIILATKIYGPGEWITWTDRGTPRLNKSQIKEAIKGSLKRLQTEYVDLYQLHWPDRQTNCFGIRGINSLEKNYPETSLQESLEALSELKQAGFIRTIGLSNETPWGFMRALELARQYNFPRVVSVQNPYSLLNRTYEIGMAEISLRENVGLLAYSPLAFGVLSGKYLNGQRPEGARITRWNRFSRYVNPNGIKATELYCKLAQEFSLSPAQMALSYVTSRDFVTSNIIGATNLEQLKENIDSIELKLSNEVLKRIEEIQNIYPDPCP